MPKHSLATEVVLEMIDELHNLHNEAPKNAAVPFMQEALSPRDEATRVKKMTPQARTSWVEQVGLDHAISVVRRIQRQSQRG